MSGTRGGPRVDVHRFAPAAPDEEHVYGACCPGWHATGVPGDAVDDWVAFMLERDVDRVCCLLSGDQLESTGADAERYQAAFGPERVRHAPVADHHLTDADTLDSDVLPFLDDAVARDERVVVHCLAGIGRTGHVLAAWLVHGREYEPIDAIETVERMGRSPAEAVDAGNARRGELYELLARFA